MSVKKDFRNYVKRATTEMLNYTNEDLYYPVDEIKAIRVKWDEGGIEQDPSGYSSDSVRAPVIEIQVDVVAVDVMFGDEKTKTLNLDTSEALTALMQSLVLGEVEV